MICDMFRRLSHFQAVETYKYVGFGSVWFSDFTLLHRTLGIKEMLSIEQAVHARDRFEANKPFWIDIDFRSSSQALPDLDYSRRHFIWLDYDGHISTQMLSDAAIIGARAGSGTALIISVQCAKAPDLAEAERARVTDPEAISAVERFRQRLGPERVPGELQNEDLSGWAFGSLSRSMFFNEISRALETRRIANPDDEVRFRVICEFEYEDGAKMTSLALVFYSPADEGVLNSCGFESLEFLNADNSPVYIPTPKLTLKEFRELESQLPLSNGRQLEIGFVPEAEAKGFAAMYRYLPNFAVIES